MNTEVVHACPPDGGGIMPCCHRTPLEVPRGDRMATDPALVTCFPQRDFEAILTARLARVEALADEWERLTDDGLLHYANRYVTDLRAALASDPTHNQEGEVDGPPCRHCGKRPEADGDHSCPCPYRDEDCLAHPLIVATPWPADEPLGDPPPWPTASDPTHTQNGTQA